MNRLIWLIAATCAAIALSAVLEPEKADAQSAVAGTPAMLCGHSPIAFAQRSLSSANSTELQQWCTAVHRSLTTVRFFQSHRALIAPRYQKWWKVPDSKWRQTVRRARALLRHHQQVVAEAEVQIQRLSFPIWLWNDFVCIHGHEGGWQDNTGNGYYGGLQMDQGFMTRYGPDFYRLWGTADHWPIWAQIAASIRAYESGRGFYPWPNTARACSLL